MSDENTPIETLPPYERKPSFCVGHCKKTGKMVILETGDAETTRLRFREEAAKGKDSDYQVVDWIPKVKPRKRRILTATETIHYTAPEPEEEPEPEEANVQAPEVESPPEPKKDPKPKAKKKSS